MMKLTLSLISLAAILSMLVPNVRRCISLLITGLLVGSLFTVALSSGSFYAQAQRGTYT
jgi:uncharacterized membrane protein